MSACILLRVCRSFSAPSRRADRPEPIVLLYLLGFNTCLFFLYYLTPLLLQHSSALFLNLSLLTSDFWSILFAVLLFRARLHPLYFLAFGIIIAGLLLYNLAGVEWSSCGAEGAARGDASSAFRHVLRQLCGEGAGQDSNADEAGAAEQEQLDQPHQASADGTKRARNNNSSGDSSGAYSSHLNNEVAAGEEL